MSAPTFGRGGEAPPPRDLGAVAQADPGSAGFEYFEVTADVGIRAWGPDARAAFCQCALGVFNLMVSLPEVEAREAREVRASGEGYEPLLVNWINELLYLHDTEGFLARRVEIPAFDASGLRSLLHGEPLDPARHHPGLLVKAATFHQLAVTEEAGRFVVRLIVDV